MCASPSDARLAARTHPTVTIHAVIIRQLDPHDAAAYQALRLRALQDSPTSFSSSYAQEANRSIAEIIPRVTPAADGSRCVFGAFDDGRLVGMLAFIRPTSAKLAHGAELAGMYVAPECRRRGFGRALLDALIAHARGLGGVRQLKLGVNAGNESARSVYRSAGFVRFGIEPEALQIDGIYYDQELHVLRLQRDA